MSSSLDAFIQDASSGLFIPPQARRQVVPYDDLQALATPTGLPQISPDLISALAILVAQGADRARLLNASDSGALYTSSIDNFAAKVAAPAALNATSIQVDDPTWAAQANWFWAIQIPSHGGNQSGPYFAFPTADRHVVSLGTPLQLALQIGDIVFSTPQTNLIGSNNIVNLPFNHDTTFPGGKPSPDNLLSVSVDPNGRQLLRTDATRAFDAYLLGPETTNATLTLNFPAPGVGRRLQLAYINAWCFSSAANIPDRVEVWKNGVGVGTKMYNHALFITVAGSLDRLIDYAPRIVGDDNGTVNVTMSGVSATLLHAVQAGCFILY